MDLMKNDASRSAYLFKQYEELGLDPSELTRYDKPQTANEINAKKEPTEITQPSPPMTAAYRAIHNFVKSAIFKYMIHRRGVTPIYTPASFVAPTASSVAPTASSVAPTASPVAPTAFSRLRSSSNTRRPIVETEPVTAKHVKAASKKTPMYPSHMSHLYNQFNTPKNSPFTWICNKISCGLFRSRRNRGGRRTIRKRRQSRRSR